MQIAQQNVSKLYKNIQTSRIAAEEELKLNGVHGQFLSVSVHWSEQKQTPVQPKEHNQQCSPWSLQTRILLETKEWLPYIRKPAV